jgi:enoyl-CoA hydratase/carnithine racemase
MTSHPDGVGREVLYEIIDDHIAVVSFNRPDKRNAVNEAVATAVDFLVKRIEADDAIRVAILTSSSNAVFCAGADLAEIAAGRVRSLVTPDGGFAGFTAAKRSKPWIAAVCGSVLGGGFELSLACDMIIASEDAHFGLPEVKRGFLAAAGGIYRLPKAIPRNIALELIVTGSPLTASRAHALGLVNYLVPDGSVREAAVELARIIAANAPLAVCASLDIARLCTERSEAELQTLSVKTAGQVMASEDAKEGPRAFLAKRAPLWSGR